MCLPISELETRTLEHDHHLGFEYQIVYNNFAQRCGYIKVEKDHPWFGRGYDEINATVHGGLTFAKYGTTCPTHGEADEWWVGFDCGHCDDLPDLTIMDGMPEGEEKENLKRYADMFNHRLGYAEVRTQEYAREECFSLARQAQIAIGK